MTTDPVVALSALHAIPANLKRGDWHQVGRAALAAGLEIDDILEWSRPAENFKSEQDVRSAFRNITPEGGTGPGTLFHRAAEYGWRRDAESSDAFNAEAIILDIARRVRRNTATFKRPCAKTSHNPQAIWDSCQPATAQHSYVVEKNGIADGLRVLPEGHSLRIAGESMAGALVVPLHRPDGTISSLQFIPPPQTQKRLRAAGSPTKLNLKGARLEGWHEVGIPVPGNDLYVCEGIGQAWACWQATGNAAAVAFGSGRMQAVAIGIQRKHPRARIVLVPDVGKEAESEKVASALGVAMVKMPEGEPSNFDANDLLQRDGLEALAKILIAASPPKNGLDCFRASDLPPSRDTEVYEDELVERLLGKNSVAVIYGDSNSGKTFLAIDLCAAVSIGIPWMGRNTDGGVVLYLAVESPSSVKMRLRVYQKENQVSLDNLFVVQSPISLFDAEPDIAAVMEVVRKVEAQTGRKVALIVGDTLARLATGANENSEEMGLVFKNVDRIRQMSESAFLLIHHCGKDAARGMRGWSGMRAHIDTEIEVTANDPTGLRCLEITKQRDLEGKGERLGFRLKPIPMGHNKWGAPRSSCIVEAVEAPIKAAKVKRMGEAEGAVIEFLATHRVGIRKKHVFEHFKSRYVSGTVYRAMRSLVKAGAVHEAAGMVCIAEVAK